MDSQGCVPDSTAKCLACIVESVRNSPQLVPGHEPVMHDKSHILLIRDLLKSAVDQMNQKLWQNVPPWRGISMK